MGRFQVRRGRFDGLKFRVGGVGRERNHGRVLRALVRPLQETQATLRRSRHKTQERLYQNSQGNLTL